MRSLQKLAIAAAVLALGAAPALALPSQTPSNQGTAHAPTTPNGQGNSNKPDTPGPNASMPEKAKAYGKLCQNESKKHVAGTPGTPFSKCVTDMAKLASGKTDNPRVACKDESKKHVAGTPGTPFSNCVKAGAKLLKDQS